MNKIPKTLPAPKIQKVCPIPKTLIKLLNEEVTRNAKFQAKNPISGPVKDLMSFGAISLTTSHGTPPGSLKIKNYIKQTPTHHNQLDMLKYKHKVMSMAAIQVHQPLLH